MKARIIYAVMKEVLITESETIFRLIILFLFF